MANEPGKPSPLDCGSLGTRPTIARWIIIVATGAVIALVGVIVFLCSHAITTPASGYNTSDQQLHEVLWAVFGITLLAVGGLLAAVGLTSWCRGNAG